MDARPGSPFPVSEGEVPRRSYLTEVGLAALVPPRFLVPLRLLSEGDVFSELSFGRPGLWIDPDARQRVPTEFTAPRCVATSEGGVPRRPYFTEVGLSVFVPPSDLTALCSHGSRISRFSGKCGAHRCLERAEYCPAAGISRHAAFLVFTVSGSYSLIAGERPNLALDWRFFCVAARNGAAKTPGFSVAHSLHTLHWSTSLAATL